MLVFGSLINSEWISLTKKELFNFLFKLKLSVDQLLKFINIWFTQINDASEIRATYKEIKNLIKISYLKANSTAISAAIRIIAEKCILSITNEKTPYDKKTEKFLKKEYPFFRCFSANHYFSYDTYQAVRKNKETAQPLYLETIKEMEKNIVNVRPNTSF